MIQTKRICLSVYKPQINDKELSDKGILLGLGEQTFERLKENFADFLKSENKAINLDLTNENITTEHADILFKIIENKPDNAFRFTYGFNHPIPRGFASRVSVKESLKTLVFKIVYERSS